MVVQPSGTVTLFFSDIEGSTRLLQELGPEAYREALVEHRRVLRAAFERHGGYEVDYEGDAFFIAFSDAQEALAAAAEAQSALEGGPISVRMGLHTGEPLLDPPKYVGGDVHLAARVMSSGHGGQVLLTAATRELVEAEVLELGEHRLKDIGAPVPLYQLGEKRFSPLKTISNTNLPRPVSSFVGREHEVTDIVELVRETRLVTLTGPGGTGKTRLAIESATELVGEFKAGVFWVGLATLRDPVLVEETIAQTLGASEDLAADIGEREMLLLLDNFEQVVEAARDLSALVRACPNLHLLVTSRELLRVDGEVEYAVPPLAENEAVELFCARSRLSPDGAIEELCRRLDSLPLAVELAAARTSVLAPAQILERLGQRLDLFTGGRDSEARQQTLRATIEWSYELLAPNEQTLFAHLSVFAGGCTLDAAETVVDADLETLQALVDRSLLRRTGDRFWMLETIREYAAERFAHSRENDLVRRRQLLYFVSLVDRRAAVPKGRPWVEYLDRLEQEHPNLRVALQYAVETDPPLAVRLAGGLRSFWELHGHWDEGRRWFATTLASKVESPARANAVVGAATLASRQQDHETAAELAREGLALAREARDFDATARALNVLAISAKDAGDIAAAKGHYAELIAVAESAGVKEQLVIAHLNLGQIALGEGALEEAESLSRAGLELAQEIDHIQPICVGMAALAKVLHERAQFDEAALLFQQALRLACDLRDREQAIDCVDGMAGIASARGDSPLSDFLRAIADSLRSDQSTSVGDLAAPALAALD